MSELPRPDLSRFSKIAAEDVVLAYIACGGRALSSARVKSGLKSLFAPERCDTLIKELMSCGRLQSEKNITLTSEGDKAAQSFLGRDSTRGWDVVRRRRLPMLAVGLDPDDAKAVQSMARPDALKAATISVAFGLPKNGMTSVKAAITQLVWLTLRAALSEVIGSGPYPAIEKSGAVERVLLAGLTGTRARNVGDAVNALVAVSCGLKAYAIDEVRRRVVMLALGDDEAAKGAASPMSDFAVRIKGIAESLTTPPFEGRVAIAQVYDAYGRLHADAGPLATFKDRLVASAKSQEISLGRLDLPERMSAELRARSEARWDDEVVHFVITKWK